MATLAEVLRQAGYVTPQGQVVGPRTDLAQKLKSYVMNISQNAAQNLANQRADIDAALTMGDKGIQIGDRAAFARQMAEVPNLMGLTAYHGTPHTIKGKFDISKVGTGEGAQAYGHGMYFAENPAVAKQYQVSTIPENALTEPQKKVVEWAKYESGDEGPLAHILDMQQLYIKKHGKENVDKAVEFLKGGNLYKVDIPDEYIPKMINWDTPFAQQPEDLRNLFAKVNPVAVLQKDPSNEFTRWLRLKDTAQELQDLGYKGIKYKDSASRGTGSGTSNYVVFDPSDVKILEQNSKPMTRKEIIEQELEKVAK